LWLEIRPVDLGQQALRCVQLAINKCRVEDQLRCVIGDLGLPPGLHLALQRFEVPLNSVHADRERVNQVEALGMLGQYRREIAWDNVSKLGVAVRFNFLEADSRYKSDAAALRGPSLCFGVGHALRNIERLGSNAVFVHLIPTICRESFAPSLNASWQGSHVAWAHAKLPHRSIKTVVSAGAQT
jgi:hypothetical protein